MAQIEQVDDPMSREMRVTITVTERDARDWDRERYAMLQDGMWLIEQAVRGAATSGPLTTPHLSLPVRNA